MPALCCPWRVARGVWVGRAALTPSVPVCSQRALGKCPAVRVGGGGGRFEVQHAGAAGVRAARMRCDASGLWLLGGRLAPAGGDAASKFPYTVGFLVESQCMWVPASALVSLAPALPGHSTDRVRPPRGRCVCAGAAVVAPPVLPVVP